MKVVELFGAIHHTIGAGMHTFIHKRGKTYENASMSGDAIYLLLYVEMF